MSCVHRIPESDWWELLVVHRARFRNHKLMLCALDMAVRRIIRGILSLIIDSQILIRWGGNTKHARQVDHIFESTSNNNNLRKALALVYVPPCMIMRFHLRFVSQETSFFIFLSRWAKFIIGLISFQIIWRHRS